MTKQTVTDNNNLKADIVRRMVQILITILIQAAILFGAAGSLHWWQAWSYIGLYLGGIAVNTVFMIRINPETIAERGRGASAEGWKDWDKRIGVAFGIFYFIGILLVAGLDFRFDWTDSLAVGWHIAGMVGFALGGALFSWAMITNAYFSTAVRIQTDRGHQVCTTGPYRFVRHPGYVGVSLQSLVMPLMLGSLWTFVPAVTAVLLLILRTALEDKTLHEELAGYTAYAAQTRYRLLPGIW